MHVFQRVSDGKWLKVVTALGKSHQCVKHVFVDDINEATVDVILPSHVLLSQVLKVQVTKTITRVK